MYAFGHRYAIETIYLEGKIIKHKSKYKGV